MVIAGDTLFLPDFSMADFIAQFRALPAGASLVCVYRVASDAELASTGILELENGNKEVKKVTRFLEKPSPAETASRLGMFFKRLNAIDAHSNV